MRQEADGLSAFARKADKIRRNQPVSGSVAPIFSGKRSILRIAGQSGSVTLSNFVMCGIIWRIAIYREYIFERAMASTISIRHFVLGLLARQPMAGYDIKRFLRNLSWLIDSPSFGTLYPTLHGLLEDGLATVERVSSQDRPTRKIYTITEAGRGVLRKWMNQPTVSQRSLKTFLMRLALASHLSHSDLRAYLEQRRAQVAAHKLDLEQAVTSMDKGTDLGERLTIDYGLVLAVAELNWLDCTLARLSQTPRPTETVTQSSSATLTL